jgi:hypothetical protein
MPTVARSPMTKIELTTATAETYDKSKIDVTSVLSSLAEVPPRRQRTIVTRPRRSRQAL